MDAKEIPYVFVDSTIDNTSPIAFFTSDHYMIGCLMAKLITSIIPNNTNIGILQAVRTGDKSANSTIQRKKRVYRFSCKKNNCFHNILNIPFSVSEPEKRDLSGPFFSKHDNVPGIVVMNSRGSIVSDYLLRNNINRVKMICMDLTSPNIEALKKRSDRFFLIGQEPEYQGFCAMKTLLEYLTFKNRLIRRTMFNWTYLQRRQSIITRNSIILFIRIS